jgi:aminomethyltransferase
VNKKLANRRSHLYEYHKEHGKITEFAGFDMPLWYRGIVEEHNAVRNSAGAFDVSHMGRFLIKGDDATSFLDHLLPSDVVNVKIGRAFYSTVCKDDAGILDDTVTNKLGDNEYIMVVNSSNRDKDLSWLRGNVRNYSVRIEDDSNNSALIAFQGPLAQQVLQKICDADLSAIRRFGLARCRVSGVECLVSRTGYTGEDGFEIDVLDCPLDSPEKALKIWNELLALGKDAGVLPCGLGARDSLRLEAGMCLYGNDMDETTTPVEASLEWALSSAKQGSYVGREVIQRQLKEGTARKRVAFSMESGGVPRHGFDIRTSGQKTGIVTSGTFSPTIKKGIGMGYVPPDLSGNGTNLFIQIRNAEQLAMVVPTPFYDTSRFGYKRAR